MANIIERVGRWRAQIRRKGFKTVSKTFSTRDAAEKWAGDIERRIDAANDNGGVALPGAVPDDIRYLPRISATGGAVGVYFLFKGDECIYVGQSTHVHTRVREHRTRKNGGKEFDSYSWIAVAPERLNEVELHYIETIRPRLNDAGGELIRIRKRVERGTATALDKRRLRELLHFCHAADPGTEAA